MSKYRIVKHQAGKDIIGYSPEIWESRPYNSENCTTWWRLAGNEQLISQDRWIASLPKTMEEAKLIIEQHIEDSKPRYSEEVVYEFDTENPSPIRKGPVWI